LKAEEPMNNQEILAQLPKDNDNFNKEEFMEVYKQY